ncbi:unnamed protein product [Callosobruchus maculatus]|uniref:Non-homologous end-joining factor 1 n=1 Tax=Callosobruchus maculatus TaxID=64391 RepID=A0A653CM20_CALMS|nr:unnamed protein product [Callosobruchus maculatus]
MWKPFATADSAYLLRYSSNQDTIEILLSNLKYLWTGNFTKQYLFEMFKKLNPLLEVDDVSSQVIQILDRIDNTEIKINIVDSNKVLEMKVFSNLSQDADYEVPVNVELTLTLSENDKLTEVLTIPMVQTINFLETQQKVLCNIIQKKDRELTEYQLEKGVISRNDLVTEPFDFNLLKTSDDRLLLNTFQQSTQFMSHINAYHKTEVPVTGSLPESLQQKNSKRKRKVYQGGTVTKYRGFYGEQPDTIRVKIEEQMKTKKE